MSSWENLLRTFIELLTNSSPEGEKFAMDQLKRMAWLADNAFKPLEITVYPMANDTIAESWGEIEHWDVILRPEGSDPIVEIEGLNYIQAMEKATELHMQFPQADLEVLDHLLEDDEPEPDFFDKLDAGTTDMDLRHERGDGYA